MDTISLIALLLVLSALFSIANKRILRLPNTIGVLIFSLLTSLAIMMANPLVPAHDLRALPRSILGAINLPQSFLNGALCLLLFAGAMQVDLAHLRSRLAAVTALSILGTVLAVALLAISAWLIFPWLGTSVAFGWCIVLGAVLAPTDPVSVVGMLARLGLPKPLQAIFAGESLFNDGVAVVIFGVTIGFATGHESVTVAEVARDFVREAIGGALLGMLAGGAGLALLRLTRDSHIDLLVSLALATGTFSVANMLGMSGAIAVVVAGMSLGTHHAHAILDRPSRDELDIAWSLIDEILNVMLFLLIGFELLEIDAKAFSLLATLAIIPLSIMVRGLSVFLAMLPVYLRDWRRKRRMLTVLTWGGLRGGISVSLALGLPPGDLRDLLLPICYGVVVFTILVQGLTMERVAARLYSPEQNHNTDQERP